MKVNKSRKIIDFREVFTKKSGFVWLTAKIYRKKLTILLFL